MSALFLVVGGAPLVTSCEDCETVYHCMIPCALVKVWTLLVHGAGFLAVVEWGPAKSPSWHGVVEVEDDAGLGDATGQGKSCCCEGEEVRRNTELHHY